jgi:hypothetical protein
MHVKYTYIQTDHQSLPVYYYQGALNIDNQALPVYYYHGALNIDNQVLQVHHYYYQEALSISASERKVHARCLCMYAYVCINHTCMYTHLHVYTFSHILPYCTLSVLYCRPSTCILCTFILCTCTPCTCRPDIYVHILRTCIRPFSYIYHWLCASCARLMTACIYKATYTHTPHKHTQIHRQTFPHISRIVRFLCSSDDFMISFETLSMSFTRSPRSETTCMCAVRICINTHMFMYTYVRLCTYTITHTYIHICTYVLLWLKQSDGVLFVCMYIHVYIYIYAHIHISVYTFVCKSVNFVHMCVQTYIHALLSLRQ